MSNLLPIVPLHNSLLDLPSEVKTPNGVRFDPRLDRWAYRDSTVNVSLDFSKLKASPELVNSAKKVLIWYAENKSSNHLLNMFSYFGRYLRHVFDMRGKEIVEVGLQDILGYRSHLLKRDSYFLGSLSGFLQKWHDLVFNCIN
jgi:hypothetical protein